MNKAGLYIHIPFCRTKCPYCGFYSITDTDPWRPFLKALRLEMELLKANFRAFDTLYIGGGTPSLFSPRDMSRIIEDASAAFSLSSQAEITIEANPADLKPSNLKAWRGMGINRINIGIQSFDDNILAFLGRRHDRRQAIAAIKAARKADFENTGIDLIYGIPGQTISQWLTALRPALSFMPEHLSCYQLTIEPDTPLGTRHREGNVILPGEDELADLFYATADALEKAGYIHYEVSNFARGRAFFSRHNQKYWDHSPYLGLGPAAYSFKGNKRWWNHRSVARYIAELERGRLPIEGSETLTEEELRLEALFLGLRTKKGVNLSNFHRRYGCDLLAERAGKISFLEKKGLIEIKSGRLKPTTAGLAVADSLALI